MNTFETPVSKSITSLEISETVKIILTDNRIFLTLKTSSQKQKDPKLLIANGSPLSMHFQEKRVFDFHLAPRQNQQTHRFVMNQND